MTFDWTLAIAPSAVALGGALVIDRVLGEPPNALHPVVFMGKLIDLATPAQTMARGRELFLGALLAVLLPSALAAFAYVLLRALDPYSWAALVVHTALLKTMFSLDGLRKAGKRMQVALASDLEHARDALAWLCSRDPSGLQKPELVAASIESIAENASDSFVAPVFFYALFGLPGAVFYRAANTLDAMIGYHGRFENFGKAAARLDDLLNWIPARLTALALLLAGVVRHEDVRGGFNVLVRDHSHTESPNAGWPMAAMAGLLGVTLEKVGHYRLGDGPPPQKAAIIDRAYKLVWWAAMGVVLVVIATLEAI